MNAQHWRVGGAWATTHARRQVCCFAACLHTVPHGRTRNTPGTSWVQLCICMPCGTLGMRYQCAASVAALLYAGIQLSSLHVATNWTLRGAIESWIMANPAAAAAAAASAAATEAAAVAAHAAAAAAAANGATRGPSSMTLAPGPSPADAPPALNSHPLTFDLEQLQALTLDGRWRGWGGMH